MALALISVVTHFYHIKAAELCGARYSQHYPHSLGTTKKLGGFVLSVK